CSFSRFRIVDKQAHFSRQDFRHARLPRPHPRHLRGQRHCCRCLHQHPRLFCRPLAARPERRPSAVARLSLRVSLKVRGWNVPVPSPSEFPSNITRYGLHFRSKGKASFLYLSNHWPAQASLPLCSWGASLSAASQASMSQTRYQIIGTIGAGASSRVDKARDTLIDRTVVLKTFATGFG